MKKSFLLVLVPVVIGGLCLIASIRPKQASGKIALQFPNAKKHSQNLSGNTSTVFLQDKPFRQIALDTVGIPYDIPLFDSFWLENSISRQNQISQMPLFRNTREIHRSRFRSGGFNGQYRVTRLQNSDPRIKEIRTLTFARSGDVCKLRFTYWQTNSPQEREEIQKTWISMLQQVRIDPGDLSWSGGTGPGATFIK